MGYTEIEKAVKVRFIEHFSELDEDRCLIGDADKVVDSMFKSGESLGCYIEYNGGGEMDRRPFKTSVWVWSIAGIFLIQYSDNIEDRLRVIIDTVKTVFDDDTRLGGTTIRIKIVDLADAYIGQINDTMFYFLPFIIEAIEPF